MHLSMRQYFWRNHFDRKSRVRVLYVTIKEINEHSIKEKQPFLGEFMLHVTLLLR
jgi:hypothetical protein